jgi:hypothetical protein
LLSRPLQDARITDTSPSQPPTAAQDSARPTGAEARNAGTISGAPSGASNAPDASAEFRSEFAALLAFYATRINAARGSLSPSAAAAIVQALLGEQAVALRGLTDRWHAATKKQRDEKPQRPTGNVQRKDDDPKPS